MSAEEPRELTPQEERDLEAAARLLMTALTPPDDGDPEDVLPDDMAAA